MVDDGGIALMNIAVDFRRLLRDENDFCHVNQPLRSWLPSWGRFATRDGATQRSNDPTI
jgi:hypothetical protein